MICVYCAYSEGCEAKTLKDCQLFKEQQQQTAKETQDIIRELRTQEARIAEALKRCDKIINTK